MMSEGGLGRREEDGRGRSMFWVYYEFYDGLGTLARTLGLHSRYD